MTDEVDVELLDEEQAHHPYSPSKLEYYERCPCFEQDESDDSEAAQRGRRLHKAVELDDPESIADEQDRDDVLQCMLHKQWLRQKYPNAQVYNEKKLYSALNSGTGDLVLLDFEAGIAVVDDYKFGKNKVTPPERNLQFWSYAYEIMSMYAEIKEVHVYVDQPYWGTEMEHFVIRRDMIQTIRSRIERVIARREDPNRQPTPDDITCDYCAKKASCSALKPIMAEKFTQQYGLTVPANVMLGIDHSAKDVGQAYAFFALMEKYGSQGKKLAAERADVLQQQGEQLEGASLVRCKGRYKVSDLERLYCNVVTDHNVSPLDLFLLCSSISPNKVAELLKDFGIVNDPKAFLEELEEAKIIERGAGYSYLKKKPKTDLQKMLRGEV